MGKSLIWVSNGLGGNCSDSRRGSSSRYSVSFCCLFWLAAFLAPSRFHCSGYLRRCFFSSRCRFASITVGFVWHICQYNCTYSWVSSAGAPLGLFQLHPAIMLGHWHCTPTLVALSVLSFMTLVLASVSGPALSMVVLLVATPLVVGLPIVLVS